MSTKTIVKVKNIAVADGAFATAITSEAIALDNYQEAKIIVATGESETATELTVKVYAKKGETETKIKEVALSLDGDDAQEIIVLADELAHYDCKDIVIKTDAITGSTVAGSIVVVLGQARATE